LVEKEDKDSDDNQKWPAHNFDGHWEGIPNTEPKEDNDDEEEKRVLSDVREYMKRLWSVMDKMRPFFEPISAPCAPTAKGFTYNAIESHRYFNGNGMLKKKKKIT
jgi:hypothetical protein